MAIALWNNGTHMRVFENLQCGVDLMQQMYYCTGGISRLSLKHHATMA
ncbi:MAG: hypothetical protein R6X06_05710 [Gammaproteobacteria bacterium]